ncbi:MAG TPA: chalcone isomerase family protein [Gammaproteobacteria bacterium]|nr:chalcone isomerase family protein [Gammaproteobacteria bacterium]
MSRLTATIFICLVLACQSPLAITISGTEIPDTLKVPDSTTELLLNGAGIREKFFVDVYVGALYLEKKMHDPAAILADTGPAGILMHFTYSEVSREKIIDGWKDGLAENLAADRMRTIEPRLKKFNALFRSVASGDVIRIDYIPGSGTQVRINDEYRGTVAGNDFFRDLLRIWLGAEPASKSLKHDMLGLD